MGNIREIRECKIYGIDDNGNYVELNCGFLGTPYISITSEYYNNSRVINTEGRIAKTEIREIETGINKGIKLVPVSIGEINFDEIFE